MIEIEVPSIDVEIVDEVVATSTGNVDIETVDLGDLAVTVAKKEYVITGDSIYVPVLYDDAPQWMKDLVGLAVEASMETANAESLAQLTRILSEFATGYVPLNQYTQSILDLSNADQSLQVFIETMNSNYDDGISEANSQIIDLQTTKASKAEVVTQVVDTIAAQLATPGSSLAAVVARIDQAIVDETSARSNSMEMLTAQIENVDSGVIANAEVLNTALAYVGIDEAGAETGSGLSAYLVDGSGNVGGATSKVANNVYVDALGNVKSKYEYNSTVSVNGSSYNSGFGLSNSSGTAIGSEFWINADKFKFTNNAKTGNKAPFSIDASGVTPEIYFNGKVQFSNITGYTPPDVSGSINSNNDIFAQKLGYLNYSAMVAAATSGQTIITGGHVNTNLINAGAINAGMINTAGLIAENISANEIVGKTMTGGIINGAAINGAVIKASYLDLDGELEVLTNYHITAAMYAANPSLYTDAIYLSASNEYRIPSMSVVREETKIIQMNTVGTVYNSKIRSYNCGNIGHNLKAVKVRPIVYASNISIEITLPALVLGSDWSKSKESTLYFCGQLVGSFFFRNKVREDAWGNAVNWYIELYFNNSLVYSFYDKISTDINGEAVPGSLSDPSFSGTFTAFGITIGFNVEWEKVTLYILHESFTPTVDYSNTSESLFKVVTSGEQIISSIWYNSTVVANFSSSTYINNMI